MDITRKVSSYLGDDVICYVIQCVVTAGARSSLNSPTLCEQQRIKQQLGLLEIFGNVYIFMHPKNFWMLANWKLLENEAHFVM